MEANRMESESLAKLAEALSKAQGQMAPAKKDSINPHFKSSYADLASCWAAIREPLSVNGLAITQRVSTDAQGVKVETMLLHVSGEFLRSEFWLPVAQKTPIGYASAITYARRYSLSAIVGLSSDDDDGSAASISANGFKAQTVAPRAEPVEYSQEPEPEVEATPAGAVVVPFGKNKGLPISGLPTKSLSAYREMAMRDLADESKASYHAKTRQWLQAVESELSKRSATA